MTGIFLSFEVLSSEGWFNSAWHGGVLIVDEGFREASEKLLGKNLGTEGAQRGLNKEWAILREHASGVLEKAGELAELEDRDREVKLNNPRAGEREVPFHGGGNND